MRILLTGITGFLGSHLARALIKCGHDVVGIKRQESDIFRLADIRDKITFINIDSGMEDFFKNCNIDIIIHAATAYGNGLESASDVVEANVLFPLRLLERAIVQGSCAFVNTDTFFLKADERYSHLSLYTSSKRFFLQAGTELALANQATFCNMRIEHMYGVSDGAKKFTTKILMQLINNVPEIKLTLGLQLRDFIFIDDVVSAYINVVNAIQCSLLHGVNHYEVGTGDVCTIKEFVTLAHKIIGSKTSLVFGGLPYRENEIVYSSANIDALKALNWLPKVKLESGIQTIVKSMRSSKNTYDSSK